MARGFHFGGAGGGSASKLWIYKDGATDYTIVPTNKRWDGQGGAYSEPPVLTLNDTNFVIKNIRRSSGTTGSIFGTVFVNQPIDVTNYKKLKVHVVSGFCTHNKNLLYVGVTSTNGSMNTIDAKTVIFIDSAQQSLSDATIEVDISGLKGNKYVVFPLFMGSTTNDNFNLTVDKIWLEKGKADKFTFNLIDSSGQLKYPITHANTMSHIQNTDHVSISEANSSSSVGTQNRHSLFDRVLTDLLGTYKYVKIRYKTSSNQFCIGSTSAIGTVGNIGTVLPVSENQVTTYYISLDVALDSYDKLCLQTNNTGEKTIEIYELSIVNEPNI